MLIAYPELSAADFARAVLIAERMDPDYDTKFLRDLGQAFATGRAAMVYAGDDTAAKETAAQLAADLGFEPLNLGGLALARYLEPAAMVWIHLAIIQKQGRGIAFGLLRR